MKIILQSVGVFIGYNHCRITVHLRGVQAVCGHRMIAGGQRWNWRCQIKVANDSLQHCGNGWDKTWEVWAHVRIFCPTLTHQCISASKVFKLALDWLTILLWSLCITKRNGSYTSWEHAALAGFLSRPPSSRNCNRLIGSTPGYGILPRENTSHIVIP